MKKFSIFITSAFLLFNISPAIAETETTESNLYAESVYSASNQMYQPNNAIGAPDSVYADFFEKDASIILDLGEEQSVSDLTIYFRLFNYGASYRVEFLDSEMTKVQTSSNQLPLASSEITITYTAGVPYRYVAITGTEEEVWSVDAIMTTALENEDENETEEVDEEVEEIGEEELNDLLDEMTGWLEDLFENNFCEDSRGLVAKHPDDNNPETTADAIVYIIGCDGSLHIFPNEQTYLTWWSNFENLVFIDPSFLTTHNIGNRVTIRPGTYLIKKTSETKVYAVEPNGVIRWIPDEATALSLYGENWTKIIIDVSDDFFADYTLGEDLTALEYPNGTVGSLATGEVVYVYDGEYYSIPGDVYTALRFQDKFIVPLSEAIMSTYIYGGDLTDDPEISYPF